MKQEIDALKDQSKEELKILERDLQREIFQQMCELRVQRKLDKPHLLKHNKRQRARVLTLLQQKSESNA